MKADNGTLSGIIADMLELVAPVAGIEYELSLQEDDIYGVQAANGSWNGMVGELIDGVSFLLTTKCKVDR